MDASVENTEETDGEGRKLDPTIEVLGIFVRDVVRMRVAGTLCAVNVDRLGDVLGVTEIDEEGEVHFSEAFEPLVDLLDVIDAEHDAATASEETAPVAG